MKVVAVTFVEGSRPGSPPQAEAAVLGQLVQTCSAVVPAVRRACCTAGKPSSPPAI